MGRASIVLPPLELVSQLVKTLTISSCINCESINFRLDEIAGLEVVDVDIPVSEPYEVLFKNMVNVLRGYESRIADLPDLPLIRGRNVQSDYYIFEKINIIDVYRGEKKMNWKKEFYNTLLEYVEKHIDDEVIPGFSLEGVKLNIGRGKRKNFELHMGSGDLRLPRLLISEGFYELGKFGGIKDVETKSGRPSIGVVEVKATGGVTALLTASMLALTATSGRVDNVEAYVIPTINVLNVTLTRMDADIAGRAFRHLYDLMKMKDTFPAILDDIDSVRLATIFNLYGKIGDELRKRLGMRVLENIDFVVSLFSPTGNRFYKREGFIINLAEVSALDLGLEALGYTKWESKSKTALTVSRLIISVLRLSKTAEQQGLYKRLASDIKMLAYSILVANPRVYTDALYRVSRALAESGVLRDVAKEASNVIESLEKDPKESIEEQFSEEKDWRLALIKSEIHRVKDFIVRLSGA